MTHPAPEPARETFAWELCPTCGGSRLGLNTYTGEPDDCPECKGDGIVRARDAKGRFVGRSKEPRK